MNHEIEHILELLLGLNATKLFTAFFTFCGHEPELSIVIYEGRWFYEKKPIYTALIDCSKSGLYNYETKEDFDVEAFEEYLILQVQ